MPLDAFTLLDNPEMVQHYKYIKNRADGTRWHPSGRRTELCGFRLMSSKFLSLSEWGLSIPYTIFSDFTPNEQILRLARDETLDFGKNFKTQIFKSVLVLKTIRKNINY